MTQLNATSNTETATKFHFQTPHQDPIHVHDLDGQELPTDAIFQSIATVEDVSPLDLEPLSSAVDPDSLNEMYTKPSNSQTMFCYHGYRIIVSNDTIAVFDTDTDA